mgnify:CR=1 FL=1
MEPAMMVEDIMNILPHRYPFLLVDRVIEKNGTDTLVAIKNVTINEEFFNGHFPGKPVMPGVLQVEAMAQAVGLLMLDPGKIPLFMSVDKCKFRKQVVPGDQLRIEVEKIKVKRNIIIAKGKCLVDGQVVSEADLMFSIQSIWYSPNFEMPNNYRRGKVMNENIHPSAIVSESAILGENVHIGPYCIVGPEVILGNGTTLESHVVIEGDTEIGENNYIYSFVSIGKAPQDLKYNNEKTKVVIGNNNRIREFVTIHRGTDDKWETRIGNRCLIMAYVHIAHDCIVGDNCILANGATLAGHVEVEEYAVVGGLTPIHQFVRIGRHSMVGGASAVNQDVVPYTLAEGNKARAAYINIVGLKRRGFTEDEILTLRDAYKIIFKKKLKLEEALQQLEEKYGTEKNVSKMIEFIRKSKRGITR